jgi:hypothetical protein
VSALVVSFVCCGLLTFHIGWKYQEDSLVTYTSDVAVPVIDVSLLSELRQLLNLLQSLQIPFPAVTFCPDLMSFYGSFDYNQLVTALKQQEISIDNVTNEEFAWIIDRHLRESRNEVRCRLKYMQAIALVTGDEFLVPFNLTIDTDDVQKYVKHLTWDWTNPSLKHEIHFDDYYSVDFTEILGASGICYNFNLVDSKKLFHLNK